MDSPDYTQTQFNTIYIPAWFDQITSTIGIRLFILYMCHEDITESYLFLKPYTDSFYILYNISIIVLIYIMEGYLWWEEWHEMQVSGYQYVGHWIFGLYQFIYFSFFGFIWIESEYEPQHSQTRGYTDDGSNAIFL